MTKNRLCIIFCTFSTKYCVILSEHEAFLKPSPSLIIHDASDGANPGIPAAPLTEPLVLSWLYQVHPSPVVWVLIEEPVALSHIAGEDVVYVEALHNAGTVVPQVHHLTSELDPFIQAHAEQPRLMVLHGRGLISKALRSRSSYGYTYLYFLSGVLLAMCDCNADLPFYEWYTTIHH